MRSTLTIIFFLLILISCERKGKYNIKLTEFVDQQEVLFETEKVIMHFSKQDILKECQKTLKKHNHLNNRKTLIDFLENNNDQQIHILDSIATKLDTVYNFNGLKDSVMYVPDWKDLQTQIAEAMKWTSIDVLYHGQSKVFDKKNKEFVDYINLIYINEKTFGEVKASLPNGTMFINEMTYIQ